ncbi:MAG: PKD domain-containing protein [Mycobacterium sp.]
MAFTCSITITSVTGVPAGSSTTTGSIRVIGTQTGVCAPTASGVTEIIVEVNCGTRVTSSAIAPDVHGKWIALVPASCTCGGDIEVTAFCATDPACKATFSGTLQCETATACPTGTIDVTVLGCDPDGSGKVDVELTAVITNGPSSQLIGQFEWGDSTGNGGIFFQPMPVYPISYSETHAYLPSGPYTAEFVWTDPANCPPFTAVVSGLPNCPIACPPGSVVITADPPGECNANGTRTVTFNASVSGITAQYYQWDFGDGSTPVSFTGSPPPSQTHDFPAPAGGETYTVTLTVTTDNGACIYEHSITVDIAECAGSPTGPGTPKPPKPPSSWCGAFTYVVAALLGVALALAITILTLNCMGVTVSNWLWYAVIGVLSAAVAAIIAWYISCAISWCPCAKKCDWLVITWIATLIGGIIAGYLSGCCPWMKYVSSGLLAVALAVFIYWCVHCKPSLCDVFAKLLVAFASGAAVALAYLALLPALAACGITWVGVAVTTTAALLAIAVANCH